MNQFAMSINANEPTSLFVPPVGTVGVSQPQGSVRLLCDTPSSSIAPGADICWTLTTQGDITPVTYQKVSCVIGSPYLCDEQTLLPHTDQYTSQNQMGYKGHKRETKPTGAIPLTLIPNGNNSCAKVPVACPIALFEYKYGKLPPLVAGSFVHPFMELVMITCGTNFLPSSPSFHFSRRGRKAKVSQ